MSLKYEPASEPQVRYAALLMRNATRSKGLVNGRIEVDAYNAKNETVQSETRWISVQVLTLFLSLSLALSLSLSIYI